MTKIPSNKSPLRSLLVARGFTMFDLKCEASLMFCTILFDFYIDSKNNKNSEVLIDLPVEMEEHIFNRINNLNIEIKKAIISREYVFSALKNKNKNDKKSIVNAQLVKPYKLLYEKITETYFEKEKEYLIIENGKKHWMPELLALYIILILKTENYEFNKYSFIKNDDFSDLNEIYLEQNKILQKTKNYKTVSKNLNEMSIITRMRKLADQIVSEFIKYRLPK